MEEEGLYQKSKRTFRLLDHGDYENCYTVLSLFSEKEPQQYSVTIGKCPQCTCDDFKMFDQQLTLLATATNFKDDKKIVSHYVHKNGLLIQHGSDCLCDMEEVALEAIRQNPNSYKLISLRLQNSKKIVEELLRLLPPEQIVSQNGMALKYFPQHIIDEEIAEKAVQQTLFAMKFVPKRFAKSMISNLSTKSIHCQVQFSLDDKVLHFLANKNIDLFRLFNSNITFFDWNSFVSYFATQEIEMQMAFLNIDSRMYNNQYKLKDYFVTEMQQLPGYISHNEAHFKVFVVVKDIANSVVQSFIDKYKVQLRLIDLENCCKICHEEFQSEKINWYQCSFCKNEIHITCWYNILSENSSCPICSNNPDPTVELFYSNIEERDDKAQVKKLVSKHPMNFLFASERLKVNFAIMERLLCKDLEFVTILDKNRLDFGLVSSLLFDKYHPKYFTSLLYHDKDNIIYCNLAKENEIPNDKVLYYLQESNIIRISYCDKIGEVSFLSSLNNNSNNNTC